jgi:two-component sensor histidine kinase
MRDTSIEAAEVRHRVANDITLLLATLTRKRNAVDWCAESAVKEFSSALVTMGHYYRRLYEVSPGGGLVDLSRHLGQIAAGLQAIYLDRLSVSVCVRFDAVYASPHVAKQLGRIVVELISNAAKHAFGVCSGELRLTLKSAASSIVLCVEDDGAGFEPERAFEPGRGLALVSQMARGLGGRLHIDTGGCGAGVSVILPKGMLTASEAA